ncbi:ATP-binding cassette domain-containing protein [Salinivirga cyanobacteriivorans]
MKLALSGLLPYPLEEMTHAKNCFWQHGSCIFTPENNYEIIAPSGRGKTTLLNVLFGIRNDYHGQFIIEDKPANNLKLSDWAHIRTHKISSVFQGLRLFRHLTGKQNIDIKNRLTGRLTDQQIESLAKTLGIEQQMSQKAGLMSYGQQQRLAILRAFAQPFEWLLLDEPFSHLDPETAQITADLIRNECSVRSANFIVTRLISEDYLQANEEIIL